MPTARITPITMAARIATQAAKRGWIATRAGFCAISSWITTRPPKSPPTIPMVIPKFGPIPHWIAGTIARAKTPYIPQRRSTSLKNWGRFIWNAPAHTTRNRKKRTIIIPRKAEFTDHLLNRISHFPFLLSVFRT